MEKLVSMMMNGFLRQIMKSLMGYGFGLASGQSKGKRDMTPDEREKVKRIDEMTKQAKALQKLTRRMR